MTDDFWSFAIGVLFGAIVVAVIAFGPARHDSPASAWENYVEQRDLADQRYREAYELEELK